ncbi:Gfo/Idh/MocA family oxidoreductase [Armatimonas sp.]|uniref:Gfo/Idh/MocA family protein n=1 Tax=Armatimonas sp. TaxID=1872638 RepID=UPI00286BCD7B|nr:Gfo/Idh/MocA family oxidoreductase [Armatimonas sp.]
MSELYRVAVIGTGLPWKTDGATGFGMSRAHAPGYAKSGKCEIVALADIAEANMAAFNTDLCDGKARQYTDYKEMLTTEKPDVVSIATWPHLHAEMVIAAAESGVKAIHCEKPMAGTFGEARKMAEICAMHGVQLTFNHQRRHLPTFQTAKKLIESGAIGELTRLEGSCLNMLDWGTHWLNMFQMLNGESAPVWVMGQVDVRKPHQVYGVKHDTDGMCLVGYENGVHGLLCTGETAEKAVGCSIKAFGTEGYLEIHNTAPHLRIRGKGDSALRELTGSETEGGLHGSFANHDNVVDLVNALTAGRKPLCDVSNALVTTEIIYACYESARRRGRIDLPLTIDDHPLAALVESGAFPAAL